MCSSDLHNCVRKWFSLAPGFSRVSKWAPRHNRFNGFAHAHGKPLKRLKIFARLNTRLKPGANESAYAIFAELLFNRAFETLHAMPARASCRRLAAAAMRTITLKRHGAFLRSRRRLQAAGMRLTTGWKPRGDSL